MTRHPTPSTHPLASYLDPILLGDSILSNLNSLHELNWKDLGDKIGTGSRGASNLYKTELMIHISYLMKHHPDITRAEIACRLKIHKDNLNRTISAFQLPDLFSQAPYKINLSTLKQTTGKNNAYLYAHYKVTFLYQIKEFLLTQKDDIKLAAKDSGLPYQKTRDWVRQYHLRDFSPVTKSNSINPLKDSSIKGTSIESIEKSSPHHQKTVAINPMARLFTSGGDIIRAGDLISTPDLLSTEFLGFSEDNQIITTRIHTAQQIVSSTTVLCTKLGTNIELGPDCRLYTDQENGLIPTKAKDLKISDSFQVVRSLAKVPTSSPSIFNLLTPPQGQPQLEFIFNAKDQDGVNIVESIKSRLKSYFQSDIKTAYTSLGISYNRYKHGIVIKRFNHDELVKIHTTIAYPDIHHPHFFSHVKSLRFAIGGGRSMPIDHLILEPDLLYLMGLIASDGYGSNRRKSVVGFSNKMLPLVQNFARILTRYFPQQSIGLKAPKDVTHGERVYQSTYDLAVNNYAIRLLMINLKIKGSHDVFDENYAYEPIFKLPLHLIAAFLQGLFDGDGHVDRPGNLIEIAVFHPERAKTVLLLFKRLGIDARIKHSTQDTEPPGSGSVYFSEQTSVQIAGKKDMLKFGKFVNSQHSEKKKSIMDTVKGLKVNKSLSSKYNRAPIVVRDLFRRLRVKTGVGQRKVYNSSVGDFELGRTHPNITKVKLYLDNLVKLGADTLSEEYKTLENYLQTTYNFDYIKSKTKNEKNEYMVQLTFDFPLIIDIGIIVDGLVI